MKPSPKWPLRSDHRMILLMCSLVLKGGIHPIATEFDRVSRVFSKAGGSWAGVFQGSPEDINLLKRVLKIAYEQGYLTRKGAW